MSKRLIILSIIIVVFTTIFMFIKVIEVDNTNKKREIPKEQWALFNSGQEINGIKGMQGFDLNITKAWDQTLGDEQVIVGILDTGIDISNPYISDSIFVTKDGFSYIRDNITGDTTGWDFLNSDNTVFDDYLSDYHGTFLASLIVGAHVPENQVWGVAPNVKILPLKFMRGSKGNVEKAIDAISYAYERGVRIINCSWDSAVFHEELYEVMKNYNDILFITSSGNESVDLSVTPLYPCNYELDNVICVVATNNQGDFYEFSGYNKETAVAAPGEQILGILPEGDLIFSDGSSYATAYVTGVSALIKSQYPNLSAEEIANILKVSQKQVGSSVLLLDAHYALENASREHLK